MVGFTCLPDRFSDRNHDPRSIRKPAPDDHPTTENPPPAVIGATGSSRPEFKSMDVPMQDPANNK